MCARSASSTVLLPLVLESESGVFIKMAIETAILICVKQCYEISSLTSKQLEPLDEDSSPIGLGFSFSSALHSSFQ